MATQLELAEAQFTGFHHGKRGYSVKELADGMGLKKSEWLKIREHLPITEQEKEEVDTIFKILKTQQ